MQEGKIILFSARPLIECSAVSRKANILLTKAAPMWGSYSNVAGDNPTVASLCHVVADMRHITENSPDILFYRFGARVA